MTMSGTILTTKVVAVSRTDILYSAIHSFNNVNAVAHIQDEYNCSN